MRKEIFVYGERELQHLRSRDKLLGQAIDDIGMLEREVYPDLFAALANSIVGQQISAKALQTVWGRMTKAYGQITPEKVASSSLEEIQQFGMTYRKAGYIQKIAQGVLEGTLDFEGLRQLPDKDVVAALTRLEGVGVWTAEMFMTFSMQRMDIVSYGDAAIHKGMRMLYHHRKITRPLFEKYRKRYSPYGTVASLYLWAIAGGAVEGMRDYAR